MRSCVLSISAIRRLAYPSRLNSISTSCCAAADADFSSDSSDAPELTDYNELQQRARSHATSGRIREAIEIVNSMKEYVPGKPTVYDYNEQIRRYFRSRDVARDQLLEVFTGMKRFGPSPNLLTYYILFNGFIFLGRLKDAILIVEEMLASGFVPSYSVLLKLFKKLVKLGDLEDAVRVLGIMWSLNMNPNQDCLSALIQGLCKAGMVQRAYSVFSSISGRGYFCRADLYNPILWGLCKSESESIYTMLAFFGLLEKKGFVQSECSYAALVYGFSKKRLWNEALHCLHKMESVGWKPSPIAYTVVIKFLCDYGKVDEAQNILCMMEEKGCKSDLVLYNIILLEVCRQGRNELHDLLRKMDQKGLSPDWYTYVALDIVYNRYLLRMCRNGKLTEALSEILSLGNIETGLRPNTITFNTLLAGLCKYPKLRRAVTIFKMFKSIGVLPDTTTYNILICASIRETNYLLIRELLRDMNIQRLKPDIDTLVALFNLHKKAKYHLPFNF